MNKTLITICMGIGSTAGAFAPQLWGDRDLFSLASILLTFVGGIIGIWVGAKLSQRM